MQKKINPQIIQYFHEAYQTTSLADMAAHTGVSISTVGHTLKKIGLKKPAKRKYYFDKQTLVDGLKTMTRTDLAKKLGVCIATIDRQLDTHGIPYTKKTKKDTKSPIFQEDTLREDMNYKSRGQIAREYNTTIYHVNRALKKYDIPIRDYTVSYTPEQEAFIKANHKHMSQREMGIQGNIGSYKKVANIMKQLGLKPAREVFIFTEEHKNFIRQNYQHMSQRELKEHIGCPKWPVATLLKKEGLKRQPFVIKPEEEEYIRANYQDQIQVIMAEHLDINVNRVRKIMKTLGLNRSDAYKGTAHEIAYIKAHSDTLSTSELAEDLCIPLRKLKIIAQNAGIEISDQYIITEKDIQRVRNLDGLNTQTEIAERLGIHKQKVRTIIHRLRRHKIDNTPPPAATHTEKPAPQKKLAFNWIQKPTFQRVR